MSKRKNNILLTLILLIFTGQAVASSVILCPMMDSTSNESMVLSAHSMKMMNHMVKSQSTKVTKSSTMDCCEENGHCDMAGCILLLINNADSQTIHSITSQTVATGDSKTLKISIQSLYRPPMSA